MTVKSKHVRIKGIKDGLVFLLDDKCPFEDLLSELRYKLEHSHQNILTGPIVHVDVKLGSRPVTEEDKEAVLEILKGQGNLLIRSIDAVVESAQTDQDVLFIMSGIIRSGQVVHHVGNLLYLGDVNPGGTVTCTGDIYVLGALRGVAHAGVDGNQEAIIAASLLTPTQLRIADCISRPPDEWGARESSMEFAYLSSGAMQIDKIHNIVKVRQGLNVFKGV
ncbi:MULTISPECIES: septum site-determining protein MinC [unclassified Paenibacillus]|uniref:septum site-determining protein MinC n=1 Tax=unclassified Paenibacillus TaxID=185978 RepID=UPI002405513C|nr:MULTISPECIES: septum site-determining protein MinC [unclassified Paenibacillus]MDF9844003.1 septum site-determining protein MinC [Paenibacillus sp. PastF-2]MDF9850608.1 septum site-determining protein MinC [Paenibacillus sp. PastM-2]MDF9857242.1 septum site-determining protein MinC [Paenibacillus sp. PastF-1]MDH6482458.1 septum site-determining protein MinC [Paenibacillus sp. PastH-2]MDH6509939.1 septum site-determining protein MinC [Paenibacillus sp. PastM-3]